MSVYFLLQAGGPQGGILGMLPMLAIMTLIFWFLVWRPQKKEQDRHKQFVSSLKVGDEVVTNSGLIGEVRKVEDKVITLEVDKRVKIRVLRTQIQSSAKEILAETPEIVDAEPVKEEKSES